MNNILNSILVNFETNSEIESGYFKTNNHFPSLPDYFVNFYEDISNGGEGFVGDMYLVLWEAEEILTLNKEYEVDIYAPGLFVFGSDGGGEAFAFDLKNEYQIVQVPFIGMSNENAVAVASNFIDFLKKMAIADGSLL